jgi:hypothetical protein
MNGGDFEVRKIKENIGQLNVFPVTVATVRMYLEFTSGMEYVCVLCPRRDLEPVAVWPLLDKSVTKDSSIFEMI